MHPREFDVNGTPFSLFGWKLTDTLPFFFVSTSFAPHGGPLAAEILNSNVSVSVPMMARLMTRGTSPEAVLLGHVSGTDATLANSASSNYDPVGTHRVIWLFACCTFFDVSARFAQQRPTWSAFEVSHVRWVEFAVSVCFVAALTRVRLCVVRCVSRRLAGSAYKMYMWSLAMVRTLCFRG